MNPTFEWLPTDPPRPAPALMTATEAAIYLRLNEDDRDIGDAITSLGYLIRAHGLRPCRVGKSNRFARAELDRFIADQTEQYVRGGERAGTESGSSPLTVPLANGSLPAPGRL